jgi:hypothetical protein
MDTSEILTRLSKWANLSEVYEVKTFTGYRQDKQGRLCDVTIRVCDAGSGARYRFSVTATDEHGRVATGNPESSLELAIASVHWAELDRDE